MKKYILALAALACVPIEARAQQSGAYAGVTIGIATERFTDRSNPYAVPSRISYHGIVPGLLAGYTLNLGGLVLGVEAMGTLPQTTGLYTKTLNPSSANPVTLHRTTKNKWEGSFSARIGGAFGPLSYGATGGYKAIGIQQHVYYTDAHSSAEAFTLHKTATGPVFGLEAAYDVSTSLSIGLRLEHSNVTFRLRIEAGEGSESQRLKSDALFTSAAFRF